MDSIKLINLNKTYFGDQTETQALRNINLIFDRQHLTAVVGSSGSGKSTLLSIIGTLEQQTSGQVKFGHTDTASLKGNQLADFRFEKIGFIFQQFHLLPALSAYENVISPFFGRKKASDCKAQALYLLEQLGLGDKINLLPSQLSGGQQQRVAIARAFINQPEWILADEPTGNLDSENADKFFDLLYQLKNEFGCGIIVVTHDINLARKADRLIEIKDGAVVNDRFLTEGNRI